LAIAKRRGHGIVGTEHLLLAMTRQSENSVARRILHEAGVDEDLRARVEAIIGPG
jgi:ATP-dependent Clp protease ATP-binding subunit ClpA